MIYDAIATLAILIAALLLIALVAWLKRSKPTDTRPRRCPQSWDRPPLTSEHFEEQ